MVILLTGASGFIGQRLSAALRAAGHVVVEARRDARDGSQSARVDFTRDLHAADWLPKLVGVDVVINAVGILRESGRQTFDCIHTRAPQALFAACLAAGVKRVVQISALGADSGTGRYFSSKRAADDYLSTLPLDWIIVQPALVYGPGGNSARLFTMLASLPVVPLPGSGGQRVQPIHVDDLVAALVALLARSDMSRQRIALVGPQALGMREFLERLRRSMGLGRALFVPLPMPLMRVAARVGELSGRSLLDRETLAMLEAGNTADPRTTQLLLRHAPRAPEAFVTHEAQPSTSMEAQLSWLLPLLRISIALVWIWSAAVSAGLYPREASYELLGRAGVAATLAPAVLYGAALLDFALGIATLALPRRRPLWLLQMAVILAYTIVVTVRLPEFWLHPYGPILKNIPLLVAIYLLYTLEPRR